MEAFNTTLQMTHMLPPAGTGQDAGHVITAHEVVTSLILFAITLTTIVGNVFVIVAIMRERSLQGVANYLIISLAVSDLLVACLVMPLGAIYEVTAAWNMGTLACDLWTSADVLCCTASILNLLAIALDRFWAVTDIKYIQNRSRYRILAMIAAVWLAALFISVGPIAGWKDDQYDSRVLNDHMCMVSQDMGYQIFATIAAFYVPLVLLLYFYVRIFLEARKRIRRRAESKSIYSQSRKMTKTTTTTSLSVPQPHHHPKSRGAHHQHPDGKSVSCASMADQEYEVSSNVDADIPEQHPGVQRQELTLPTESMPPSTTSSTGAIELGGLRNLKLLRSLHRKETAERKRERKAAKTLSIVTGVFIACWLPFFVMALTAPLCQPVCEINPLMASIFIWLGWLNSTLNPIIYTVFSPEFRKAFTRMLCGRRFQRQYAGHPSRLQSVAAGSRCNDYATGASASHG